MTCGREYNYSNLFTHRKYTAKFIWNSSIVKYSETSEQAGTSGPSRIFPLLRGVFYLQVI